MDSAQQFAIKLGGFGSTGEPPKWLQKEIESRDLAVAEAAKREIPSLHNVEDVERIVELETALRYAKQIIEFQNPFTEEGDGAYAAIKMIDHVLPLIERPPSGASRSESICDACGKVVKKCKCPGGPNFDVAR